MVKCIPDKNKITTWLLLSLGIVVAFCVAIFIGKRNYIPSWVDWTEREVSFEHGKKGNEILRLTVGGKKFSVSDECGEILFETNIDIKVQDAIATDVDGDGLQDIIAVVWKRGLYGKHRPFWVTSDEKNYSQHVFIYGVSEDGEVSQKWFASETGILINRIKLMDKKPQIVMFEDIDGDCTLWQWESFGLKNIENKVKIVAFGDNLIHDAIIDAANKEHGRNYDFLYEPFLDDIRSADIAALNAETVLVDKESMVSGYPSFGSPVAVGEAIADAGFDIAVCANNHVLDKGIDALEYTRRFYEAKGIKCLGIQDRADTEKRPYEVIKRNGISFALFAYTYGTNAGDISDRYPNAVHYLPRNEEQEKELLEDLQKAREEVDIIIVFVHWGEEYELNASNEQMKMAALFAKGGADAIIGSHPHVMQEVEELDRPDGGKTVVYYSLGNFRADQGKDENTKTGGEAILTASHTFDGAGIVSFEIKKIDSYWMADNNSK